jgi:peroxiredoxin family protein
MLEKFLHTLEVGERKPKAICFYTEGVKILCTGSSLVPGLKLLEGMEIRLAACGSCLDYFGLTEELQVGDVVGMNEIVALMMEADSIITV